MLSSARRSPPVQHEHPLLADPGQPAGQAGRRGRGLLLADEPARGVQQAQPDQSGHRVHQAGAAQALRFGVADHLEAQFVRGHGDDLDGAVGGPHPALDRGALERGPGRGGRGQQPVPVAQDDLAVGADVDEQAHPGVPVHPAGQQPGRDVAADVGAERGEHHRAAPRVHGARQAQVGREHLGKQPGGHDEGRHAERFGVDAEHQVGHGGVARHRDLVHLIRLDAAPRRRPPAPARRGFPGPAAAACPGRPGPSWWR